MKITATSSLAAPPSRVFGALVDPDVLRRCIPGCETLTETAPGTYDARLKVGVAGLKGVYTGSATIRETNPPGSLTLAFDGKGTTGFVRGSAVVRLAADGAGTHLTCDADVQVGGLIAAVGSRLVEAASRKLADDFFRQLSLELTTT